MTTTRSTSRHVRSPRLTACLAAAIILGVLSMHVSSHQEPLPLSVASHHGSGSIVEGGSTSLDGVRSPVATSVTAPVGNEVLAAAAATARAVRSAAAVLGPAHSTGDLVMSCTAMLIAAAAGALSMALLALRRSRDGRATLRRLEPLAHRLAALRRSQTRTGPPSFLQFSVIRC